MHNQQVLRERHWLCARRLSERRRELRLTQRDVVERLASLGVFASNRTLSAIEHGQGVDIGRLPELAVALDCTVTYLLGLTADPLRWDPDSTEVPVTVDLTEPIGAPVSWILGPNVPERAADPVEHHA